MSPELRVGVNDLAAMQRGESMRYLIVIEKSETGYSAYSPDLDGCVATCSTKEDVERSMREAIEFHIEGLREERYPVPPPSSYSTYTDVPV